MATSAEDKPVQLVTSEETRTNLHSSNEVIQWHSLESCAPRLSKPSVLSLRSPSMSYPHTTHFPKSPWSSMTPPPRVAIRLYSIMMMTTPLMPPLIEIIDSYLIYYRWFLFGQTAIFTDIGLTSTPTDTPAQSNTKGSGSNNSNDNDHKNNTNYNNYSIMPCGPDEIEKVSEGIASLKWSTFPHSEDPNHPLKLSGPTHEFTHVCYDSTDDTLVIHSRRDASDQFRCCGRLIKLYPHGTVPSRVPNDPSDLKVHTSTGLGDRNNTNSKVQWLLSTLERHETLDDYMSSVAACINGRFYISGGYERFSWGAPNHNHGDVITLNHGSNGHYWNRLPSLPRAIAKGTSCVLHDRYWYIFASQRNLMFDALLSKWHCLAEHVWLHVGDEHHLEWHGCWAIHHNSMILIAFGVGSYDHPKQFFFVQYDIVNDSFKRLSWPLPSVTRGTWRITMISDTLLLYLINDHVSMLTKKDEKLYTMNIHSFPGLWWEQQYCNGIAPLLTGEYLHRSIVIERRDIE
jgi:hypothetical protein